MARALVGSEVYGFTSSNKSWRAQRDRIGGARRPWRLSIGAAAGDRHATAARSHAPFRRRPLPGPIYPFRSPVNELHRQATCHSRCADY